MASLIANWNTSASQPTRSSPVSCNFQLPHVFVIPPEEEQLDNPPWCCFDADEQPEYDGDVPSDPDVHFLDVPYLFQQSNHDIPVLLARRTSIHQPRPRAPLSKKLEKKQRPEAIRIIETKSSQARQTDAREDSDVIEVVKVKRCREAITDLEENSSAKRPKTLKARASKALRSIKNVSKTTHRSHVREIWTSSGTTPGIFKGVQEQIRLQQRDKEDCPPSTAAKKGSLSRGNSRSLSQLFLPMKPSRMDSTFPASASAAAAPAEPYNTLSPAIPSSLAHISCENTNLSPTDAPTTDYSLHRPVPPIPPMKRGTITKFSVRELHRLFSFSLSASDNSSPSSTATAVPSSCHSGSRPSISTSASSHNYPDAMEEDTYMDAHFTDHGVVDGRLSPRHSSLQAYDDDFCTSPRLSNFSFEMKLDSLHFDALSFDPKDCVSREENFLR